MSDKLTRLSYERMVQLDTLLRDRWFNPERYAGVRFTAPYRSKRFETSVSSIWRSKDFLADRFQMPIEDNRKLGFHYTSRPRVLPRMNVSEKELITLCAALQSIERHRGTIFEEGLTDPQARFDIHAAKA